MAEKERSSVVIARMKDRIGTLEKEHNVFQNKMHVSYQETQQMQMKVYFHSLNTKLNICIHLISKLLSALGWALVQMAN